uniref:Uncharacterized protein n=1 Tax=Mustela putorius furo TaxID=9669 RepID=M3XS56_MUSPF
MVASDYYSEVPEANVTVSEASFPTRGRRLFGSHCPAKPGSPSPLSPLQPELFTTRRFTPEPLCCPHPSALMSSLSPS